MRLNIVTIVLDGMPFLPMHLAQFNRLQCDWHWYILEGVAEPIKDTGWCKPIAPRLSHDGSTEWLDMVTWQHPRISVLRRELWPGKTAMFNAALELIKQPGWLLEVDVDELWSAEQLARLVVVFEGPLGLHYNCAKFFCHYFVGPNIITTMEDAYGNNPGEWTRFWKFFPGLKFASHEPPVLGFTDYQRRFIDRNQTKDLGLVFEHYAYAYRHQLVFKEKYYGYDNAVAHWEKLQTNVLWPCKLKDFFPWADDRATADLLWKSNSRTTPTAS